MQKHQGLSALRQPLVCRLTGGCQAGQCPQGSWLSRCRQGWFWSAGRDRPKTSLRRRAMADKFWQSKAFWLRPEGTEPTCGSLPPPCPLAQPLPVFARKKVEFQMFLILLAQSTLECLLGLKQGWTGPGQRVSSLGHRWPHSCHLLPCHPGVTCPSRPLPLWLQGPGSPHHGAFLQAGPRAPACCCHAVVTWQRNCLFFTPSYLFVERVREKATRDQPPCWQSSAGLSQPSSRPR